HIALDGEPRVGCAIGNVNQLVHSGGSKEAGCFGADVVGQIILLQGRQAEMEMDVHEKPCRDHRQEDRTIGIIKTSWRPNDGLFATPLLNGWHQCFSSLLAPFPSSSCAFLPFVVCTCFHRASTRSGGTRSPRRSGGRALMRRSSIPTNSVRVRSCTF